MLSPKSILAYSLLVLVLDIPWLVLTQSWVADMVRSIQVKPMVFRVWAAPIVYIALGFLLHYPRSIYEAFLLGAAVYAVFDFTNYAVFEKYQLPFAIADTLWGGALFSAAYFMKGKLSKWLD